MNSIAVVVVIFVLLVTVPIIIGAVCLSMILAKNMIMKNPVIIAGHRKKNRVIIRDERLKPAFWKMQKWFTWNVLAATLIPVIVGFAVFYGNWPLVICTLVVSAVVMPVLVSVWHKSKTDFYQLVEAWGVVTEKDETAVKGEVTQQQIKLFPQFVALTITMSLVSVLQFSNGNLWLGTFGTLVAAYSFGYTVFVAVKKIRA